MVRKSYIPEQIINKLREADLPPPHFHPHIATTSDEASNTP